MEKVVNRSVFVVLPREPFLAWASSFTGPKDAPTMEELTTDPTAYLVSAMEEEGDDDRVLEQVYAQIFERELASWSEDEKTWPKNRSLETFEEWFDVLAMSLAVDLAEEPLEVDIFDD